MTMTPEKRITSLDLLARTRTLLETPWGEALESDRALLGRRAAARSRSRKTAEATPGAAATLLLFRLGKQCYGLELGGIEKVLNWRPCVGLPGALAQLLGITEVNGEILSIIDLRRLLGLPSGELEPAGYLILLGKPELRFALQASAMEGILTLPRGDIQPPPLALPAARARYLRGMTPAGAIVLDAENLLNAPELTVRQEA